MKYPFNWRERILLIIIVKYMKNKKELTIEEMKSLVSLATLLPTLLDKIATISKDVAELKASFIDIKGKYNANTTAIIGYKDSVDNLIKTQPDIEPIQKELETIKQALLKIELGLSIGSTTESSTKKPSSTKPVKKEKPKDEDKDKVEEIVDKILADHRGRKTRMLTLIDVKNGFKVDDIIAVKVLKWFEDRNMYNAKMHMLTFPKR